MFLRRPATLAARIHVYRGGTIGLYKRHGGSSQCDRPCWQCRCTVRECNLFCSSCSKLQPLHNKGCCTDYFSIMQIPQSFNIDIKDLEKNYKSLQMKLHPDMYQVSSVEEKEFSADLSMTVNEAYNTLKAPLSRAGYLLSKMGKDPLDERTKKAVDNALLMEVMETRYAIEEAETKEELVSIKSSNDAQSKETTEAMAAAFTANDTDKAYDLTVKLQYLSRIDELLVEKIDD